MTILKAVLFGIAATLAVLALSHAEAGKLELALAGGVGILVTVALALPN